MMEKNTAVAVLAIASATPIDLSGFIPMFATDSVLLNTNATAANDCIFHQISL
jgi:hypothetical protein